MGDAIEGIMSGLECTREQTNIDLFAKVALR